MADQAENGSPAPTRVARSIVAVAIAFAYAGGMTVLVAAPLQLFLIATHRCGAMATDGFHLSACGAPALVAIGALTLLLSVFIGGLARVMFRHQHFAWPWLALLTLATVYGVSLTLDRLHSATDMMHAMSGGDNTKAGAFLGFWILMVGYAAQAVWEEARDRAGGYFSARMADRSAKIGRLSSVCPHCGAPVDATGGHRDTGL